MEPRTQKKNGKDQFVVPTYDEYIALREDLEDLLDLRAAKEKEGTAQSIPLDQAKEELDVSSCE
ncbi:MAG: type II toxin-antitoxin system Phd/YefM family antitoxin [bacterium]